MSTQQQNGIGGSILRIMGKGQGFLKAGFLGQNKSGKTWTAVSLAIGVRAFFGLKGPIAMYDTETGSEYIAKRVKQETGLELVGTCSRSLKDLIQTGRDCEREGVSVLIADSITHPWRELCTSYLETVNVNRAKKKLPPRYKLEFQDWGIIKELWAPWTEFYLNSKLHIIVCGRAGFDYDYEENEETGRKELIKTGVKMKTEGEFGFEPSLLIEMERVQDLSGDHTKILHRATVIGDRFGVIDGKAFDNPTFDFFKPHLELLTPGAHAPVDTANKTVVSTGEAGDADWQTEHRQRAILCEEIQGLMVEKWPGQTAEEKSAKLALLEDVFHTRSWTRVENTNSSILRDGLQRIRETLRPALASTATDIPVGAASDEGSKKQTSRKRNGKTPIDPESGAISPRQRFMIKILADSVGWNEIELASALNTHKGIPSIEEIPATRYDEICDFVEAGSQPSLELSGVR